MRKLILIVALLLVCASAACIGKRATSEVVVYAALDQGFSEPILRDFEKQTGIRVRTKFDGESTKTIGLTTQLITEGKTRTRCDLFWNNEILNTLRLDNLSMLEPCSPKQMEFFPAQFRSPENRWFGFAARARVLIVNTEIVLPDEMPSSIYALLDEKWKGKVAMAKPLFGTTATHATCLFEKLGDEKARQFFEGLQQNDVRILSGNKQVAKDVAAGRFAFGLTDTDDAILELDNGFPVTIVYPDSQPGEIGTLFIPNTLAILRDGPNTKNAKRLLDFLLTKEVEQRLAEGKSAQIPLSFQLGSTTGSAESRYRVRTPSSMQAMEVDFRKCAERWQAASRYLKREFMASRAD